MGTHKYDPTRGGETGALDPSVSVDGPRSEGLLVGHDDLETGTRPAEAPRSLAPNLLTTFRRCVCVLAPAPVILEPSATGLEQESPVSLGRRAVTREGYRVGLRPPDSFSGIADASECAAPCVNTIGQA